ncbi:leucine-rich repeat protein [Mediterraneibacter glycyrrhizinilyticus]|uniref:leucine-rich repeat protein n=1 Tax=Mediterraneibacter glycyrrhizinilyticus TaxID=342942 RepID=UPI0025A39BE2|nr:leucine-rich repeat protein [Mediterraneibacter glycyrrhizinilyticus]MDM8209837.1 leucine-rich repeat protein [Mediterraneibacter glycyrrhizinilyticus]
MQAKRKLTALLLSLCMLLGMLPMTAFAAGVPAAPTNLKLEVTADGLKVSWDKPASTGGLDIFEYEVTLYGHFDGIAGGKTKVETKTVQRETTCTFTNTGNAEGVINPNYEVEVKAREGVSGTGDPDNLGNYQVTDWTDWSNASTVSLDWNEVTFNTTINNYYTGVVDVGLPDSENKLYKEGITATGNPDVTYPDGTTSDSEERAVTELLYQYFEENKQTVPDLENVTVDDLTVEAVLDRFESSQEGDGNSWTPTINATVNRYYTLRLVYNPEADSNNPDEKQIVNAVNLVNVSWNVGMGLTPAFTATVDEADQDKYEVYLEQWIGSDGKSITSEESFNSEISEDERITTFEEGVTYRYSVWVKAKEGYAISEEASVYLNGRPANKGYTLTNHDEPKRPDGSFLSGTFNSLFVMECVFDQLKVNGIEVTSANKDDILGDADGLGATVSYDPDTNTLTLNNATLTVSEDFAAIHALIPNLTIVLKGENQINGSGSTENGIYSNGNLTITGDGILKTEGTGFGLYGNTTITITGGADVNILVTFSSANAPQPYSAVRALRGLTVDGADLTAWNKGENGEVFGAPGISASLTAKNGADVRIVSTNYDAIPHSLAASGEGTKVLAFSESSDHYGIGADGVEGTITISDGATVTARGGKGAMKSKPDLTGYTNPYIKAGAYSDSATEVTDPANTDYHMNTFVEIKAGETPIDSFTYEINGESVTITGYTGSEGNVTIPSEIEGKPVTAIGERAFSQNKTLTSVAIPDSVTSIGVKAFYKSGLENINIPAGVTTIGISAFEECFNLSGVTFEKDSKLTEIKSGTFLGCGKLTSIEIPAGVTSIGIMAFYFCSDLTSVTFEEGSQLSSIRESAFERCTGLTDITIPDGVTSIRSRAFNGCEKLGSITFTGNTAPELEADDVFGKCAALTAIHVPCGADGYTAANGWPEDKVQKSEHRMARHLRVPATCTTDGTIEHWRCALCGGYFLDEAGTKEISEEQIVEKATGHDWGEPVWNWSDDGKTATVTFTCKRDEKHTAEPDVTVTQEVKTPATCTEKGVAVDTAKAVLDGKEYTSINENSAVEIAALGHKAEKVEGKAPTATEPGNIEYWYCPQCDTYFKDADLTEVITKEQTVLAPTGEAEPSKPEETPSAPTDPPQDKPDKTDDTTESPQTGDSSNLALWIGLMLASCGGVLGMLFYRRKKAAAGK